MRSESPYTEVICDLYDIRGLSTANEHSNRLWEIVENPKINGLSPTYKIWNIDVYKYRTKYLFNLRSTSQLQFKYSQLHINYMENRI